MEDVSGILGGTPHIGIVVKGKKVRDNNRTLQQISISWDSDTKKCEVSQRRIRRMFSVSEVEQLMEEVETFEPMSYVLNLQRNLSSVLYL